MHSTFRRGFTIVELLIVIVVIAILAAVTIVAYRGISQQASESALKAEIHNGATKLKLIQGESGTYPASLPADITPTGDTSFSYLTAGDSFCLAISSTNTTLPVYKITQDGVVTEGSCPVSDGAYMQSITGENCPTTRTRVVDARDGHTYWVQKLDDGECWMLTHLAYAGGGANTYGDVKGLVNGTGENTDYTQPRYYVIPATVSYTVEPSDPSISTTGQGQYGYLYNWCAVMGAQLSTGACSYNTNPLPDANISICPSGWRAPTGGATGEFAALNAAVNGGSTSGDAELRNNWLSMRSGNYRSMFMNQGGVGLYWSSSPQTPGTGSSALSASFSNSNVNVAHSDTKGIGMAVRCLAI